MASGRPFPNITTFLRNQTTSQPLFLSTTSAPPFLGSTSMMSFEGEGGCNGSFFRAFDIDDNGDDDYFHQPDKKRRLSANQVQFLEKSFEEDNKLEPERKTKLAKDLALQPRQVAIWFQNRRARWKTKQLEKDFDTLHRSYDTLKANYDILLREKHMLKAEVASLSEKVLARGKQEGESEAKEAAERTSLESISEGEGSKVSCVGKQEDISSAMSDILDSSSLLDHGDSSYAFEPDQSDEEDDLSKTFLYPSYLFPKLEDVDYSYPPENSCNFGFPEEDQALWTWAY